MLMAVYGNCMVWLLLWVFRAGLPLLSTKKARCAFFVSQLQFTKHAKEALDALGK
jgi:hypothetical protein